MYIALDSKNILNHKILSRNIAKIKEGNNKKNH